MSQTYQRSCFCGAVEVTVTGEPVAAGFCHCASCRSWGAAPVNAFSLWKPEAGKITTGEDSVGVYHKTEKSYRKFCNICGGHLLTDHPPFGLIDVHAATIPTFHHEPKLHVHYGETVLRITEGLPKMRDMPKEMGGSGETLPEQPASRREETRPSAVGHYETIPVMKSTQLEGAVSPGTASLSAWICFA
jgi:hypothetical protein